MKNKKRPTSMPGGQLSNLKNLSLSSKQLAQVKGGGDGDGDGSTYIGVVDLVDG